jgi:hypothetical protein
MVTMRAATLTDSSVHPRRGSDFSCASRGDTMHPEACMGAGGNGVNVAGPLKGVRGRAALRGLEVAQREMAFYGARLEEDIARFLEETMPGAEAEAVLQAFRAQAVARAGGERRALADQRKSLIQEEMGRIAAEEAPRVRAGRDKRTRSGPQRVKVERRAHGSRNAAEGRRRSLIRSRLGI